MRHRFDPPPILVQPTVLFSPRNVTRGGNSRGNSRKLISAEPKTGDIDPAGANYVARATVLKGLPSARRRNSTVSLN